MIPKINRDSLLNTIFHILAEELPDAKYSQVVYLADKISEAAAKWMPKHGDFWLNEDDGVLYVNKGWEVVCAEAFE